MKKILLIKRKLKPSNYFYRENNFYLIAEIYYKTCPKKGYYFFIGPYLEYQPMFKKWKNKQLIGKAINILLKESNSFNIKELKSIKLTKEFIIRNIEKIVYENALKLSEKFEDKIREVSEMEQFSPGGVVWTRKL